MTDSISDFVRFKYKEENFQNLKDYCEDNNIWICQSMKKSGDMTFALAKNREIADKLEAQFG